MSAKQEQRLDLVAGRHPNGELVLEKVAVEALSEEGEYRLLRSPLFVRGIARGDSIKRLNKPAGAFELLQHGGNLCVRVLGKGALASLAEELSPAIEKLGGYCDLNEERALVYSVHVGCGFQPLEQLLDAQLKKHADTAWFYGNVYDPDNGEPLNWWQPFLAND